MFFDEFQDLHGLGGLGSNLLDVFFVNDHVLVFFVLVALHQFGARHRLVFHLAIKHLFDAGVVALVKLVETYGFTAGSAVQFYGKRHQPEGKVSFPYRGCHVVKTS